MIGSWGNKASLIYMCSITASGVTVVVVNVFVECLLNEYTIESFIRKTVYNLWKNETDDNINLLISSAIHTDDCSSCSKIQFLAFVI